MGSLIRLFVAAALVAVAIIVVAVGLATNDAALAAPAHLIVFIGLVALYLLPTGIALYRGCSAKGWITALNILLGWTLFGWFIALGWAAGGKVRPVVHVVSTSQAHPISGH
jgi:hypothetical protein